MYFVYSFLLTTGLLLLSPYFLYQAWRHGKYLPSLRERLGWLPAFEHTRPVIWLHCVSVGETQAARPLAQVIRERYPDHDLVVTTTTLTGQNIAREVFADLACRVFYFPFDWRFAVRRTINQVHPSLVLIMETEIWPNFLRECGERNIPVAIVNGRLSERSFRRYQLVSGFIRRVLGDVQLAAMQSTADAERIVALGLAPVRSLVAGNIKFDLAPAPAEEVLARELCRRFGLDADRPVIVAASTHTPEEAVILAAYRELKRSRPDARLVVVPRHPERFAEVAALINRSEFSSARRSGKPDKKDRDCDVVLLDSIGELRAMMSLADLVFVGGSIAATGGHNVLEPAALKKCIITGAHTFNFTEIVGTLVAADALVQLGLLPVAEATTELARHFRELLADDERRAGLAQRAFDVVQANRGATDRTVEAVGRLIPTV
ncbi:MAG: 3-deoxy-D-manno-octulosonic acid transferase [Pyrinomonadaceae bacterium]